MLICHVNIAFIAGNLVWGVMMKMHKLFLEALLVSSLFITSCVWKQNGITKVLIKRQTFLASVSNVQLVNNQFILSGQYLDQVSAVKIQDGTKITNYDIVTKTANQLIVQAQANIKLSAGKALSFIISDAYSSATFTIGFDLCTATLGPVGHSYGFNCSATDARAIPNDRDVLTFNAAKGLWEPNNLYGMSYKGAIAATPNFQMPAGGVAGDYYIVGTAGHVELDPATGAPTYSTPVLLGDWIIFSADSNWEVVSTQRSVVTFNGRLGNVLPKKSDYSLNLLADVIDTGKANGTLLKYNGTNWVPTATIPTDAVVDASIHTREITNDKIALNTLTRNEIVAGTLTDSEISATAAIAGTKIGAIGALGTGSASPTGTRTNVLATDTLNAALAKLQFLPTDYVSLSAGSTNNMLGNYNFTSPVTFLYSNTPTGLAATEVANAGYVGSPWSSYTAGSASADAVRLTGKVGIGISPPTQKLQVEVANGDGVLVSNAGSSLKGMMFNDASTARVALGVGTISNHPVNFYAQNGAVMTLDSGNVGIGITTTPAAKLDVVTTGATVANFVSSVSSAMQINLGSSTGGATNRSLFGIDNTASPGFAFWKTIGGGPVVMQPTAGSVGIGTSNPTSPLHVKAADTTITVPIAEFENTGTAGPGVWIKAGGSGVAANYVLKLTDGSGATTVMTADGAGNVAIGPNTANARLMIDAKDTGAVNYALKVRDSASSTLFSIRDDGLTNITGATSLSSTLGVTGATSLSSTLGVTGATILSSTLAVTGTTQLTGNVGIGNAPTANILEITGNMKINGTGATCTLGGGAGATNCTSDIRLKENVFPITDAINKIMQISGVEYDWNDKSPHPGVHAVGVIAQDVEKVFPSFVITDKASGYKMVDYAALVSPIIQAFKEFYRYWFNDSKAIHREIASVKAENAKLQKENADIKAYLCAKDPAAPICK